LLAHSPAGLFDERCKNMTTSSADFPAMTSGALAAIRGSMSRGEFFAGLYVLGCANGLAEGILQSARAGVWTGGFLNISVIVWFAAFAGIALMLRDRADEIHMPDLAVAAVFLMLVLLPVSPASWAAVTGLSLYVLLFPPPRRASSATRRQILTEGGGTARRRGAVILLALTVPMVWSRLLFHFFARPVLDTDAWMVSSILGTYQIGNMVRFADDSGFMVVFPDCSSLKNVGYAFLCWASITQFAGHRWSPKDVLFCFAACASAIVVNVTRISLMGLGHAYYLAIHNQWGDMVANTLILCLTVGICVLGVRRELFPRP
jgi:hypothetical protein